LHAEVLLRDPRIDPLCIIDLADLEVLEGLAERGPSPVEVLRQWKDSSLAAMPLRNAVLAKHGAGPHLRPTRMQASVDATFDKIVQALRLRR
jgi:hypothetical protein